MHNQEVAEYEGDVVVEVIARLRAAVDAAVAAGVPRGRLLVDPGIGFGKTGEHNLEILHRLAEHAGMAERTVWRAWAAAWSRPGAYAASASLATRARRLAPVLGRLPGGRRWTDGRHLPDLPDRTFRQRWDAGDV